MFPWAVNTKHWLAAIYNAFLTWDISPSLWEGVVGDAFPE